MGRIYGPDEYATVAAMLSIVAVLGAPTGVISAITVRYAARSSPSHGWMPKALIIIGAAGIAGTLLLAPAVNYMASLLTIPVSGIWITLVCLPFLLLNPVLRGILQAEHAFGTLAAIYMLEPLIKLIVGTTIALGGGGMITATIGIPISMFLIYILTAWRVFRLLPVPQGDGLHAYKEQTPLAHGFRYVVVSMSTLFGFILLQQMDTLMAKHIFDVTGAGLYAAASNISKILLFGTGSISTITYAYLTNPKSDTPMSDRRVIGLAMLGVVTLASILATPFIWKPTTMFTLLYGSQFEQAAYLLPYYIPGAISISLLNLLLYYFIARDAINHIPILGGTLILEALLLRFTKNDPVYMATIVSMCASTLFIILIGLFYIYTKKPGELHR
jgi:O-antigen/teichoic acid export membrane protein